MNRSARLKQLAGQSFVYGLGGLVSRAVGIVLLPVYFRHVSRIQFGDVELIMSTITLAAIVFRLGLTNAMFRFSFDTPGEDNRRKTVQTTFTSVMLLSTMAVILGLIFLDPLASVLGGRGLTIIGLTGLWVSMNFDIVTGIYRIERRPTAFVVYSLTNVAITVVMTVLLVVHWHHEAAGLMIGNFSGTYVTYALMLIARRDVIGIRLFDRELLRRMLHFSVPLIPAGLALWALNVADRFQVKYLGSPGLLGSYSAASKIALSIMLLIAAFQTAWPAFANSMPSEDETRKVYAVVLTYWSMVMAWAVVAISLATPTYIHMSLPRTVVGRRAGGAAADVRLGAVRRVPDPERRRQPLEEDALHAGGRNRGGDRQRRPQLRADPVDWHRRRRRVNRGRRTWCSCTSDGATRSIPTRWSTSGAG